MLAVGEEKLLPISYTTGDTTVLEKATLQVQIVRFVVCSGASNFYHLLLYCAGGVARLSTTSVQDSS